MALPDFLSGFTCVSLYSRCSLCSHSERVAQKLLRVAQKTILHQQKNISHRSYVAHQNYVSHKKIFCGKKINYVTHKRQTHGD